MYVIFVFLMKHDNSAVQFKIQKNVIVTEASCLV